MKLLNRLIFLLLSGFVLIGAFSDLFAQKPTATPSTANDKIESVDLMVKALECFKSTDLNCAIDYANRAIAKGSSDQYMQSTRYSLRAKIWAEMGNYQNSVSGFETSIKLHPEFAEERYSDLARVRVKFGDLDKALTDAEKAVELKPDNFANIQIRGEVHFARKEYDAAITDFTKSNQLFPFPDLVKCRAEAYRRMGKVELAQADEKSYNADMLKNFQSKIPLLPEQAAKYYRKMGEYRSGIRTISTPVGELPTYMTEYIQAIEDFTSALKINPNDFEALKDRAEVYRNLRKTDLAQADEKAAQALAQKPKSGNEH